MTEKQREFFMKTKSEKERINSVNTEEIKNLNERELQELQTTYLKEIAHYSRTTDSNISQLTWIVNISIAISILGLVFVLNR